MVAWTAHAESWSPDVQAFEPDAAFPLKKKDRFPRYVVVCSQSLICSQGPVVERAHL